MKDNDVTLWLEQLVQGDEVAAQRIWERYFERLVQLARNKLRGSRRREADEEDVALSAFNSFCQGAAVGRFPRLNSRDDLWKLLVTLTARKAVAQLRREYADKRGGGAVRGESVFLRVDSSGLDVGIARTVGREPTAEFAGLLGQHCQELLDRLHDEPLQQIAVLKLEGYSEQEIAVRLACSVRTVRRKLARIRAEWKNEVSS